MISGFGLMVWFGITVGLMVASWLRAEVARSPSPWRTPALVLCLSVAVLIMLS